MLYIIDIYEMCIREATLMLQLWWPGYPCGSAGKESACNAGDLGLIPGVGRSPGKGKGYPLQYSCLENPMDGGAWQATVHGVTKNQTGLSDFTSYHPLQYSDLENSMDCIVHGGVTKSQT